jgi:ATP-dependent exoDNAse (exonuclease V) alpha subunit
VYDGNPLDARCFYPFHFRVTYFPDTKEVPWYKRSNVVDMLEFDYAYAITVHKSQGSEWGKVILADDGFDLSGVRDFRKRWLYTAVTRAKEELLWLY